VKGSTQTAIRTVAGPGVSYTVTTTVTQLVAGGTAAFTAQLRDAAGNAAPGMGLNKTVTWSTTSVGGSFSPATSPVDSGGIARVTLTVGGTVGQSLTVSGTDAQGITGRSPAYTATAGTVTTVRLTSPRILLLPLGNTSFSATFQALNEFGLQLPVSFTYAAHGGAATISPSGLVSAVGVGQAMLTAFDPSGLVGDSALVAVVDPFAASRDKIAAEHGCRALAEPEELIGLVEAAVVAAPTGRHAAVSLPLLEAGIDLLIEKPIAACRRMIVHSSGVNLAGLSRMRSGTPILPMSCSIAPHSMSVSSGSEMPMRRAISRVIKLTRLLCAIVSSSR
jgi:hypothetical protein